jgi:hypothetical protein
MKSKEELAEEYADNTIGFMNENYHLLEPCKRDYLAGYNECEKEVNRFRSALEDIMQSNEETPDGLLSKVWLSAHIRKILSTQPNI